MKTKTDAITLEVVRNALGSIADEMALVIMRTAYSAIVRDSMDYSTGVCDRHGQIVAHGLTMALHLGSFPDAMRKLAEQYSDDMNEGDIFIFNDPYTSGGMHLPDVYIVKPIFVDDNLEGYATTVVHQIDMGGIAPGSAAVYSNEIFQEGLRLPIIKMYERGEPNPTFMRIMTVNTRMPEKLHGDMRAQVAACTAAERDYCKLVRHYGSDTFRSLLEELHNYAEKICRDEIRAMPDGQWTFKDYLDGTGDHPEPIPLQATVTIRGDEIEIDWTGSAPQVNSAINCPSPFVKAAGNLMIKCFSNGDIPNFEGYTRAITQITPEGTIVNPVSPAACAARAIIGWRAIDVLLGVFSQIIPEKGCAAGEGGVSFLSMSGFDRGERFVYSESLAGSWGAMRTRDGVFGIPNAGGNITNVPIEMLEAQLPVRAYRYGVVENSGGPGKMRGAPAYIREYQMLADETVLVMRSDRRRYLPFGLEGGYPGTPSINMTTSHIDGSSHFVPVMPMGPVVLQQGDIFCHVGAGGGGYGDPLTRDPQACLADYVEELFSKGYIEEVYGVVINAGKTPTVDTAATDALRTRLRGTSRPEPDPAYLRRFLKTFDVHEYTLHAPRQLEMGPGDGR